MFYGYARVSTEGQHDTSIQVQLAYLERQAKDLNMEFKPMYEKASGKNIVGRAVLQQVLSEVKGGDIVGVYDNSRLGRNTEENLSIVRQLYSRGVQVQISGKIVDPNNPQDELLFSVESAVSTFYRKNQLMKSLAGQDVKRKNGDLVLRGDMFGWNISKVKGKTIATLNPDDAKIVQYIYEHFIAGESASQISRDLTDNYLSRFKYNLFTDRFVAKVIRRPLYAGYYMSTKGNKFQGMSRKQIEEQLIKSNIYPPIISLETWFKAFDSWKNNPRPHAQSFEYRWSAYELSSVIKCAGCGAPYAHSFRRSKQRGTMNLYVCNVHRRKCTELSYRDIRANVLEWMIRACYFITLLSADEIAEFFKNKKSLIEDDTKEINTQIQRLNELLNENKKKTSRLVMLIEDDDFDIAELKTRIGDLKKERVELEKRKQDLENMLLEKTGELDDLLKDLAEERIETFIHASSTQRRDMYLSVMEGVFVHRQYFDVKFINGKRFEIDTLPRYSRMPSELKFKMYYNDVLQNEGIVYFDDFKISFNHPETGDPFVSWSYAYDDRILKKVQEFLIEAEKCTVTPE